jgi:hypothetical protein
MNLLVCLKSGSAKVDHYAGRRVFIRLLLSFSPFSGCAADTLELFAPSTNFGVTLSPPLDGVKVMQNCCFMNEN